MNRQLALTFLISCLPMRLISAQEPIIGGPCEGCNYVYIGIPAKIDNEAEIVTPDKSDESLIIQGVVTTPEGKMAPNIIIYAYQTDAKGIYPKGSTRHGNLRAWVKTDDKGQYRFKTIRPGSYPERKIPQHVHMHIIEPGKSTYYIDDIIFNDDPLLTDKHRKRAAQGRAGSGLTHPQKTENHIWLVERNIILGQNIPNYRKY